MKAIEFPGVQSVQIIFNCFRHARPRFSFRWRRSGRWAFSPACHWRAGC